MHNKNLGEGSNESHPLPLRLYVWLKGLRLEGIRYESGYFDLCNLANLGLKFLCT